MNMQVAACTPRDVACKVSPFRSFRRASCHPSDTRAGARIPVGAVAQSQARVLCAGPALQRGATLGFALRHTDLLTHDLECWLTRQQTTACMRTVLPEKDIQMFRPKWVAETVQVDVQARAAEGAGGLGLLARQDLAAAAPVAAVLEAPALFALMQRLLQVGAAPLIVICWSM